MHGAPGSRAQDVVPLQPEALTARWTTIWSNRSLLLRVARLQGADDPEDAAQEAMLRAVEHPEIADDRLAAWLVSVTVRLCVDEHRRRVREASRWQRWSGRAPAGQIVQDVEGEICERSEASWVASLAGEVLPPRQLRALELTAEGFDMHQVALRLGVRYRAAESLLARARRTLRAAITASIGAAMAWMWRWHLPEFSGSALPVALASVTTATLVIVVPPVATPQPTELPALSPLPPPSISVPYRPAVPAAPDRAATAHPDPPAPPDTPNQPAPPAPLGPEPPAPSGGTPRGGSAHPVLPLPHVDTPTASLPSALPQAELLLHRPVLPRVDQPLDSLDRAVPRLPQPPVPAPVRDLLAELPGQR